MAASLSSTVSLKQKAERFEQLFSNSGVGIFIVDKERLIIEANEAFCKIFGYLPEEILNHCALDLHLSYAAYVNFAEIAFNKVRQNEALNLEYPFKHKNGKMIWLRIAGDSIPSNEEVLWTISDITERIETQERLRQSEALLRNAEAIAHFGSWEIVLDERGQMKWSEEMFRIYGEDPHSFHPTLESFHHYLSPKNLKRMYAINEKALFSGKSEMLDYEIVRKDGSKVFINTFRKAIYDENGIPLKLVGTTLDITKQKENERKIKQLNETLHHEVQIQLEKLREKDKQLQYQSRLIQMGEMLSMIAHQWRQPLAAIGATTSYLLARIEMDEIEKEAFQEEVEHIEGYVLHLSKTIDDFRNFFKALKQKESVTLEALVERTLTIVKPLLMTKNISIFTEFTCNEEIETYGNELAQVILNIIKNAEDALMDNGIKEPTIWIRTYCDSRFLFLEIRDNAGGIEEALFEKIFEAYFSTKLHKDGTGVGLCMSKTVVEEHCRGVLKVHNEDGGAVFTIILPK
ncbi:PAS domain-containing sensor histidine kinase [Sulfurospirillum barnesii]|uniref:histidine kinase n=1 Tax=Sulfurospirillum barnesii (strain ATCC 700032 / DSM 10660 / SES-3) TaxID=760154 RepID=I3Y029_SULBS|nr:HAMP domain-containing sensor histidine kinase [Sulfurospirillum barnesii]AFL69553.1 PAS domain S-box [Sulfurospirillum barnesii SES-3]